VQEATQTTLQQNTNHLLLTEHSYNLNISVGAGTGTHGAGGLILIKMVLSRMQSFSCN
jgi:hypothetical protein